jgi:acetolactate synthase I/II/III large subunit
LKRKTISVETVAEAYLTLLAERGIEYLFANGGTDFAPIVEAVAALEAKGASKLKVVSVAHENVAVSMAHGYFLMTGRPAAVMFHVNVGTANGINGLVNCARDNIPILFTAGRNPITEFGKPGSRDTGIQWGQEMFDQAGMVRELVKWDYELRHGDQLEDVVDRALEIATMAPGGPVYLSLPREVLSAPMSTFSYRETSRRANGIAPGADPAQIERAADILAKAERPLMLPQMAGRTSASAAAVADFADRFAIPVVEYRALANSLPTQHPMNVGFEPVPYLHDADAILSVDAIVPWIPVRHGNPPDDCKFVTVGADPTYQRIPIRSYPSDATLAGAVEIALPQLAEALEAKMGKDKTRLETRRKQVAAIQAKTRAEVAARIESVKSAVPIHPVWATHCIAAAKGDDTIVINEYPMISRFAPFAKPRTYFGTPSAGGLGWGVGAAIGAKIAAPDRMVIATLGDGAYMFGNPTAGHMVLRALDLPILFIIFNNSRWEEVERAALSVFPDGRAAKANRVPVADLGPEAHYEHMMDVYGGYGERVERPEDLPKALERAIRVVREEKRQALLSLIVGHR